MEEKMTRKGFLAAAAAAGVAALVPGTALADESQHLGGASLAALDVASVEGTEALDGSEWETLAAGDPVDVVKSHSGVHVMNAPGYFVFTGWDEEHDWAADLGFGFTNGGFVAKASRINLVDGYAKMSLENGDVSIEGRSVSVNGVPLVPPATLDPIASVVFPTTPVTGSASGKVVTINIENTTGMLTTEAGSVIATVKEGFRPRHVYNQLLGYNKDNGAWLMMSVRPDGDVTVYHMWYEGSFTWAKCYASATYVAS